MKLTNNIYTFLIILLFATYSFGQNSIAPDKKESLIAVLENVKKKFEVEFNYSQEQLKEVSVTTPDFSTSLSNILLQLERETKFTFQQMDSRFIIVKLKKGVIVCGFLKNKDTNVPIESATIQGLTNATTSDENGFFRLQISSPKELITIRHISYKTIQRISENFTENG